MGIYVISSTRISKKIHSRLVTRMNARFIDMMYRIQRYIMFSFAKPIWLHSSMTDNRKFVYPDNPFLLKKIVDIII